MKKCKKCNNQLELSKSGLRIYCKKCNKERTKQYKKLNPEKYKQSQRKKYENNLKKDPEYNSKLYRKNYKQNLISNANRRARLKGVFFDLCIQDISIPETCPVLGILLSPAFGTGKISHNSPTIDRINLASGYTKNNICIISNKANVIKNNATVGELEMVLKYVKLYTI